MDQPIVSSTWKTAYPGACIGVLAMHDVTNPANCPPLDKRKTALEEQLRARFQGQDRAAIRALPTLAAYAAYYRHFKKTYHVQLQLESIALKGKSIPRVAALVEAMFVSELQNLLLTAGHDLDIVKDPIQIRVSNGNESYLRINGQEQELKKGDMYIRDGEGILSSIIYGPDHRTQITEETRNVLFTVYAPRGIDEPTVLAHLRDIRDNVHLVAPQAQVALLETYKAE